MGPRRCSECRYRSGSNPEPEWYSPDRQRRSRYRSRVPSASGRGANGRSHSAPRFSCVSGTLKSGNRRTAALGLLLRGIDEHHAAEQPCARGEFTEDIQLYATVTALAACVQHIVEVSAIWKGFCDVEGAGSRCYPTPIDLDACFILPGTIWRQHLASIGYTGRGPRFRTRAPRYSLRRERRGLQAA